MSDNVAIITGITGQDGAYLAELLLSKGYKIIGVVQDSNSINKSRLEYLSISDQIEWKECLLTDKADVTKLLQNYNPSEFYNLAAQSSVFKSYQDPILTLRFNTLSVATILECIRQTEKK